VKKAGKRLTNIKTKFLDKIPSLGRYNSRDEAYQAFHSYFRPSQTKFLDIALERYYEGRTLEAIASRFDCTREYIRQCEEKALNIIAENSPPEVLFTLDSPKFS